MNCPACGHENRDTAKFCDECGAGLAARAREHAARLERAPTDYTPKHLADKILRSRSALEGERKQVTVLFADVKGSMELAEELDPEEWHGVLDRFFQILTDGVHLFEGTVNQYTGDGIMALFGAPLAHEDHAQRGCYAALHLRDELERYADELRVSRGLNFSVRMGLNSGEVVVGKIGDDLRMDYTARGHMVGLAQRMEQIAESGHAYVTERTAALVEGYFEVRDLGLAPVKGSRDPVRVYALEGPGALRTRLDVSRARGFSKFVGRESEMDALESALAAAADGAGRVVAVAAEPGTGKSRLCWEFAERCRARGVPVFEAHGLAHGRQMPLLPILELMRGFFGIEERDTEATARERIAACSARLGMQEELSPLLDLMGVPDPARPLESIDPEARHERMLRAIEGVLLADPEPAVLLIEDLHWLDATSDGIVARIVAAAPAAPRLVVVNFRPEYEPAWAGESGVEQLSLQPLDATAIGELLDDLLGRDSRVSKLHELIASTTRGNPFFIEEVVQMLVETGVLVGRRGAFEQTRAVDRLAVPDSVRTVLGGRIDRLGEREKRVLQTAAVIGKHVTLPLLARVAELPESELAAALSCLRDAEFLVEAFLTPQIEYAFKHPLTEAVAYESQLRERRTRVHAAVAQAIEDCETDPQGEHAARLAYHWELAREPLQAARWHSRAAEWIGLAEPSEALRHWRRVRQLTRRLDSRPGARLLALACHQTLNLGWRVGLSDDDMRAAVAETRDNAGHIDDPALIVRVLCAHAYCLNFRGAVGENVAPLTEALQIAEAERSSDMEIDVLMPLQDSMHFLGRLEEAEQLCTRVIELTGADVAHRNFSGTSSYVESLARRGAVRAEQGSHREAQGDVEQALGLSEAESLNENLLLSLTVAVRAATLSGAVAESLPRSRRLSQLALKSGSPLWTLTASLCAGIAHVNNERWVEAIGLLEHVVERIDERGLARHDLGHTLTALARAYLGAGRAEEAASTAERAVRVGRSGGTRASECTARIFLARARLASEGATARRKVRDGLKRAEQLVDETGAEGYRPFIHEVRALLSRLAGKSDDTESELHEAHRLFADAGATAHAERVGRELASGET